MHRSKKKLSAIEKPSDAETGAAVSIGNIISIADQPPAFVISRFEYTTGTLLHAASTAN
jgi:hypothetical protein